MTDVEELIEDLRKILNLWRNFASQDAHVRDWQPNLQLDQVINPMVDKIVRAQFSQIEGCHDLSTSKESHQEIIHYTSLDTLFAVLRALDNGDDSYFRMYDSFHLNDPEEGQYLARFIDGPDDFHWLREQNSPHAYVASFVIPNQQGNQDSRDEDNLKYWLAYGRRGQGCSIRFPVKNNRFRRVLYGEDDAKRTIEKLDLCSIWNLLQSLIGSSDLKFGEAAQHMLADTIGKHFAALRYLYKDKAYSYEQECRLVKSALDVTEGEVHFEQAGQMPLAHSIRHYYQDPDLKSDSILVTGSIITLGPLVPRPRNVGYYIETLLGKVGLRGPRVEVSKIPYQEPFQ